MWVFARRKDDNIEVCEKLHNEDLAKLAIRFFESNFFYAQ